LSPTGFIGERELAANIVTWAQAIELVLAFKQWTDETPMQYPHKYR
jgi:hypothetical protein